MPVTTRPTAETAFVRAVLEDPDDDAPRLVYADWLVEHGEEERAEVILTQIKYASTKCLPECFSPRKIGCVCGRDLLRLRAEDLLGSLPHGGEWLKSFAEIIWGTVRPPPYNTRHFGSTWIESPGGDLIKMRWSCGFISEIHLSTAAFLEHAEALFAAHPVTAVRLSDREPLENQFRHGRWAWMNEDVPIGGYQGTVARLPHGVPNALWPFLRGEHGVSYGRCHWYDASEEALAALSRACVSYGRKLAGLPEIVSHQEVTMR